MPICLIPMDGSPPMAVDKAVILFGRQNDCDIVLKNSRKVSRRHCCIAQINGELVIRDLGSMNGVRINGELIRKEGRIRLGDELFIGDVGYRIGAVDSLPKKGAAPAAPKPMITPDPKYFSQDVPVMLPDPGKNAGRKVQVEETAPRLKAVPKQAAPAKPTAPPQSPTKSNPPKPRKKVIEITDDDVIDE
jgi:predicted component of type VI protein secretion system